MSAEVRKKELIVVIYEKLFSGQDITQGRSNFWDEFFLLKPSIKVLKGLFEKTNIDIIEMLQPQIQRIFNKCLVYSCDSSPTKMAHAIQTLDCILLGLSSKIKENIMFFLMNKEEESVKLYIKTVTDTFDRIVNQLKSPVLKMLMLHSFTLLVSLYPKVEENPFSETLIETPEFIEPLKEIIISFNQRLEFGKYPCQIFGILLKFRKGESPNKLQEYLIQLNDELVLNGLSFIISHSLSQANISYRQKTAVPSGFISSISSMFSSRPSLDISNQINSLSYEALILFLYQLVAINPNNAPNILLYSHKNNPTTKNFVHSQSIDLGSESETSTRTSVSNQEDVDILTNTSSNNKRPPSQSPETSTTEEEDTSLHNVLADFLEYTSIMILEIKVPELLLLTEFSFDLIRSFINNPGILALIHDNHTSFHVTIHRIKTRHRNAPEATPRNLPAVIFILDLSIEFIQNHLMRSFPFYIYENCLQIIHGLVIYQREMEIRIDYDWKVLWMSLLNTAKHLTGLDQSGVEKGKIFSLLNTIMKIFNIFILYSSELLKSPEEYDFFNYELIRMEASIEKIYDFALSHTQSSNLEYKKAAMTLISNMGNMRAIVKHFLMKIENFNKSQNIVSLTEQQVLSIIQDNYESLNLRVYEDLDKIDQVNAEEKAKKHSIFVDSIREKIRLDYPRFSTEMQAQFADISSNLV